MISFDLVFTYVKTRTKLIIILVKTGMTYHRAIVESIQRLATMLLARDPDAGTVNNYIPIL